MRISDWSSDVCSSDLVRDVGLDDAVIGARDRSCLLVEPELFPRLGDAELRALLDMFAIVHADCEIFARPLDRREETHRGQGPRRRRGRMIRYARERRLPVAADRQKIATSPP